MRIVVIGRGNVGGGLQSLWQRAGHEVTALGRDGGEAGDADVVVVAVPGDAIPEALGRVAGLTGKLTIDTTNSFSGPPAGFPSLAHQVKSIIGGPLAKALNTNFAAAYDHVAAEPTPPSSVLVADRQARDVARRLVRDAGFDPVYVGGLELAATLEAQLAWTMMIAQGGLGPFFYWLAQPGTRHAPAE